jgi:hypothetical protein
MNKVTKLNIYVLHQKKMYIALQYLDDLKTFEFLFILLVDFTKFNPFLLFLFF